MDKKLIAENVKKLYAAQLEIGGTYGLHCPPEASKLMNEAYSKLSDAIHILQKARDSKNCCPDCGKGY